MKRESQEVNLEECVESLRPMRVRKVGASGTKGVGEGMGGAGMRAWRGRRWWWFVNVDVLVGVVVVVVVVVRRVGRWAERVDLRRLALVWRRGRWRSMVRLELRLV